ncbi:CRISPR-associated protein Cas10/Cmr2, subtype III-B [Synechococcus sp. PCC 7502]|uniref:type III-B CRISPR-associated protein Cas10/Cmr2 n=1 Tax=Synechococcus sp. PCC 7502 TaxID=1173263 RepID=UPI00029FE09C|nr:type III-B CRISPR-associated protein Cas10/Cmr2 [Synechococcus sp. PCC 7502]AFY74786.1 CRISPR-associated protein Cas10/Cmr2, subtype III-B [Synechococcus sp. PCC 7502]
MSKQFWQAKIWGLLHDPALKALHTNYGRGEQSFWQELKVMEGWKDPASSGGTLQKHVLNADYITSASDRAAVGSLSTSIDYEQSGLEISHLLSSAKQNWVLNDDHHRRAMQLRPKERTEYFLEMEKSLFPQAIKQCEDPRLVFWWLWRYLPQKTCQHFNDDSLLLMPAETRIPDGSIWSHVSLTAAMAGALAGYDLTEADIKSWTKGDSGLSRPYLAAFTFSPIQELIKASRKMRDFWAGSWILHYLSAKVCWALAWKYGPDSLVYPSLYAQPLIDYWLLHGIGEKENDFKGFNKLNLDKETLINDPTARQLLTAGFPNVIVMVLPQEKVKAAMQCAEQTLKDEWIRLGSLSFDEVRKLSKQWMPELTKDSDTWQGWLNAQWQTYWSAVAVGDPTKDLRSSDLYKVTDGIKDEWTESQNRFCLLNQKNAMFLEQEREFLTQAGELRLKKQDRYPFKANVGSWWCYAFDRLRGNLQAVKSARDWQIPTAFGVRSTISGIGSVLHPTRKMSEQSIKDHWKIRAGLFDGSEMLNATEVTKRALHKVLPQLFPDALTDNQERIDAAYPDLTAGVAGYLKTSSPEIRNQYVQSCQQIINQFPEVEDAIHQMKGKWGIPYADEHLRLQKYHSRLLNAGWVVEDLQIEDEERKILKLDVEQKINQLYPRNNPADWYVLGAGDGDSMSSWLKGEHLGLYAKYVPQKLRDKLRETAQNAKGELRELEQKVQKGFEDFLTQKKRMGASTHSALSRALLDFSNQLVPYLTEERYAGRLIYGGGDDVLAYTNLWEWDKWLWDIRQCFRGSADPRGEFNHSGDYWRWAGEKSPVAKRPLFTMGSVATISFGIVVAHHSVPLAIALENMWQAEEEAKEHEYINAVGKEEAKDAVQVRVIYGNGNILKATCKFNVFDKWKQMVNLDIDIENSDRPALFEQAATVWEQHPAPEGAINAWATAFCDRRDKLNEPTTKESFQRTLTDFLNELWKKTDEKHRDREIQNWLKLAAFILRKREIHVGGKS